MDPSRQCGDSLLFGGLFTSAYRGLSMVQHKRIDCVEAKQIVIKACGISVFCHVDEKIPGTPG